MNTIWAKRNPIVANLFNPAFCGEIIRLASKGYIDESGKEFPFAFVFMLLPILLHKNTRERMPRTTKTYLFAWVDENEELFLDFGTRAGSMVKYSREALSFALLYKKVYITKNGGIMQSGKKAKVPEGEDYFEYNDILKRAEMLGKWLAKTGDVKSIFSFFRITP